MNTKRLCVGFMALVTVLAGRSAAQTDYSKVEITTTHVARNIYMLEGSGGNIGVSVGQDGILIVDDQYAPLSEKIKTAIKKIKRGDLAFVLNTHYHGDHTGGNPQFGRDATIIAHTNVRKRLSTTQKLFGRTTEPMVKEGLPVITFDDSLSIHFNGEDIQAIHFPHGHTDGDIVIFFPESNVVHMGDHFFNGMFPFVDLNHGGDVLGFAANVESVIEFVPEDVKVIPGHGPLATLSDLKTFHRMLVETTAIVRSRIAAGRGLEQTKSDGLPEKFAEWGNGFISTEKWLDTVYTSLSRKSRANKPRSTGYRLGPNVRVKTVP